MSAGKPDVDFVRCLQRLADVKGSQLIGNLNTLLTLKHLWEAPLITADQIKKKTQTSDIEMEELVAVLEEKDLLTKVRDAKEWVLSDFARKAMGKESPGDLSTVSVQEWIEERLKSGESLRSSELAEDTGLSRTEVTNILRHLRTLGRAIIDPAGPQRGPNTRWIAP